MAHHPAEADAFDDALIGPAEDRQDHERLTLSLEGYEGPLDLLLDLARKNKLDLAQISILSLADQYLAFIREARQLRLEVAGDYLVMAAWLTYLKSRLLLPKRAESGDDPEAAELAEDLAQRLMRLDAMRKLGQMLGGRLEAMRQCLPRGAGEALTIERSLTWQVSLHELAQAFSNLQKERAESRYTIISRATLPIPEARSFLDQTLAAEPDWQSLDQRIAALRARAGLSRSARASALAASLELVRDGKADLRQERLFAPIDMRRANREPGAEG
jgi:segregation and condensation protein A